MASTTPSHSPTRRELPNPHPYAIKTTSTGILTRSNSSKAHGSWARHKYTPVPHSPSGFIFDPPHSSPSPNHRHTKSTSDLHGSPSNKSRRLESPQRSERSGSMSPSPSKYSRSWVGENSEGEQVNLPRHPYIWTPAHLGTYLSSELLDSHGEPLDPVVIQDIVAFIQDKKIGGRVFLGLDEEDFQEMEGVDETWRNALWDASCTLRQDTAPYRPSRISSRSYKRGRVRGLVGVFERSASENSDAGEDDSLNQPLGKTDLPPEILNNNRKVTRNARNRGWSVSGSEDESAKSEWERARHSRSHRDSATNDGLSETPIEEDIPQPHLQPPSVFNVDLSNLGDTAPAPASMDVSLLLDPSLLEGPTVRSHPFTPPAPAFEQFEDLIPESPVSDLPDDHTPNNREVEILSVDAHGESEPSMAELYEQTYGVPAPTAPSLHDRKRSYSPTDLLDEENIPGETVKIIAATLPTPSPSVLRPVKLSLPPPPSLTQLFVPSPVPEEVGTVEPQKVYVLPVADPESSEAAQHTLDKLKLRLEVVERRLEAIEKKDAEADILIINTKNGSSHPNGGASSAPGMPAGSPGQGVDLSWPDDGVWSDRGALRSRQSAYILLAGAATGISVVLVPILCRHLWTR